jgi:SAM-dependent methyltransferase
MPTLHVQYGCAFTAPEGWVNFDASPTLRFERIPGLGRLYTKNRQRFPADVRYGDITRGLPGIAPGSCDGVYCSHVLEHLTLEGCRAALRNTRAMLKPGGVFRLVVPDLEAAARDYLHGLERGEHDAAVRFLTETHLGRPSRPGSFMALLSSLFGHAAHLWMWDRPSLKAELADAGFGSVRDAAFNDSEDPMFARVEDAGRFDDGFALEARP